MPTLALRGCNLAYELVPGPAAHAVFVHACAANAWATTPAEVAARGIGTTTYDRRGYFRSPGSTESWERQAEDLAEIVRATAPGKRAVLVGWSLGSVPCLIVARKHPELVKGVVLVEPAYSISGYRGEGVGHMLRGVVTCLVSGKLPFEFLRPFGARSFLRWAFDTDRATVPADVAISPDGYDGMSAADREDMMRNASAIYEELSTGTGEAAISAQQVAEIACPVTVLVGKHTVAALRENAPRVLGMLSRSANAKLVEVEAATHLMPLQEVGAKAIAEAVRAMASIPDSKM
ncbi:Alpha/Beta hydrolase protein [Hyaloraphidium curvatum]|nr:Alpha/Beta hydrolase protein [Hyaloraphidium curvatum]